MPGIENLAPERTETRSGLRGVAEALAGARFDRPHRPEDVVPEACRKRLAGFEVVVAGLGRDREARRRREPGVRHLGEAGALAAEQVLHGPVAFRRAVAPGVDVALGRRVGTRGRSQIGHGAGSPSVRAAGHGIAPRSVGLVSVGLYRRSTPGTGTARPALGGRIARGSRPGRPRSAHRVPRRPRRERSTATLGSAARPRRRPARRSAPHDRPRRGHPRHRRGRSSSTTRPWSSGSTTPPTSPRSG